MRRPRVTSALAASALAVLTLSAAASSAPKPRRGACETAPGAGAAVVPVAAKRVSVRVGLPTNVDMRTVPKLADAPPTTAAPPELPSPGIARAKKLKGAVPTCIPQVQPMHPGAPALR